MSKNVKRIVIAGGVAVIILLAFVMLKYVFPEPEPPATDLEVTPTPTAPVYYVIQENGSEVKQFQSTYADGSTFTIDITALEDGGYEYTATPDDTFFGYNTSKYRSMMYTMTSLTATAKVDGQTLKCTVRGI